MIIEDFMVDDLTDKATSLGHGHGHGPPNFKLISHKNGVLALSSTIFYYHIAICH